MQALDIARWQFAITTIYHFLLVPITIGLSGLVALMQTRWVRTGDERYLRMTRFWGKLLLINFALGVATGIVQEFQFGMAWSEYSRFVGDVFGAPLAIEGLAAFFLESTFLGLWIFGWDRLPQRSTSPTIWAVFIGTQPVRLLHPRRQRVDAAARSAPSSTPSAGRAELTSIWEVLTNKTALFAYGHTVTAAVLTAGMLLAGISAWHRWRHRGPSPRSSRPPCAGGCAARSSPALATIVTGHFFGQWMTTVQPMKMASAEALYETKSRRRAVAVRARRRSRSRPTRSRQHRDPRAAVVHGHRQLQRHASRASTTSSASTSSATGRATTCPCSGSPTGRSGS